MNTFFEENGSQHYQTQHLQQSLWLHSPDQKEIANLNKKQHENSSINSSENLSDEQPTRVQRRSQKIIYQNQENQDISENYSSRDSNLKCSIKVEGQNNKNNVELNYTFQKSLRNREISFERNHLYREESINDQIRGSMIASPIRRLESSKRYNNGRPANVQKELLNRFMQIYQKQKHQLTKLDVIVKLKTKLKKFFINYTYQGRTYLLKDNYQIRKFIRDKSDILAFGKEDKSKFNKKQIAHAQQNQNDLRYSMTQIAAKQNYFDQVLRYVGKKINKTTRKILTIQVIKPHYDWVITLNIIFVVLNYIYFYFLSMITTFEIQLESKKINQYNICTFIQWIIEICVKLNTATFHGGQFIYSRKTIIKHYLQGNFIFDIIPLVLILFSDIETSSSTIIRIFMFIKLINNFRLKQEVEKILLMRIKYHYYIDIFNLVLNIYLVGHLIVIGFYNVVRLEINYLGYTHTFIDTIQEFQDKWWQRYISSIEWAFTLMCTGSNVAETTPEVVYMISIQMIIFVLFGYIINMIGFIILEMQKSSDEKNRDINVINNFMNRKHTSQELKHKVNLDLEYYYQRTVKKKSDIEQSVLGKISQELSDAIALEYNKKIISKIKFLNNSFSQQIIDKLCVKVEESFYSPNQTIFKEDHLSLNPPLIYIISGKAEILKQVEVDSKQNDLKAPKKKIEYCNSMKTIVERNNDDTKSQTFVQVIGELKKGQIFGEKSFFTGSSNPYEIRSTDFTTVLKLERSAFISIIKENEKDFQVFNEIKDKSIFLSDFQQLGIRCKICKSYNHEEMNCPRCHLNKNNSILFDKLNYSQMQERTGNVRKIKQKFNARFDMVFILRDVEKIIDQIEIESVDEQLYQTLEANDFSQENESQDLKLSIESSSDEKYEKVNSQGLVRQPSQKLSINPAKFEQDKQLQGSAIDIMDKNPSYLSANIFSRQLEDESNYSVNQNNSRNNSFVVGSHLQPVSINYKNQIDQQIKDHRDKETLREKSLTSIKERDLISQKSSMEKRSRVQQINQGTNNQILEELQKIFYQFQMMSNNRRSSYINSPFRISNTKNTGNDKKAGTLYEQNIFAEERLKQDQYWMFDSLQDYEFYFQEGNHSLVLQRHQNIRKKLLKEGNKAISVVEKIGSKRNLKSQKTGL
ncbi:cyclic nucleotide-binding domain protein (macronuclear) [Tetrahymena thermophila SB210]|uniref:Cyclic nucleotide-binding domain protein n=1 Tax=Tetrahymena thermophila (strain SB210) TaxID=312017 RepID=I7M9F0_TETTS|nr:cyclic nucleotide-binding domain protein [Tetrahymena thermophila SB210]EAS01460.3 cyclic nucleotide-binding domain protein [Tetrahymena thermophila SB210]|eukprot:XP_001021706.3 cyclic nucleotide-binding domain protein [Tetrahymena thermophila SB210]